MKKSSVILLTMLCLILNIFLCSCNSITPDPSEDRTEVSSSTDTELKYTSPPDTDFPEIYAFLSLDEFFAAAASPSEPEKKWNYSDLTFHDLLPDVSFENRLLIPKVEGYKMSVVSLDESGLFHFPAMRYAFSTEDNWGKNNSFYVRVVKLPDVPEAKTMTCSEFLRKFRPEISDTDATDRIFYLDGKAVDGQWSEFEYDNGTGGLYSYIKDGIMFNIKTWDINLLTEELVQSISYDYVDLPEIQLKAPEKPEPNRNPGYTMYCFDSLNQLLAAMASPSEPEDIIVWGGDPSEVPFHDLIPDVSFDNRLPVPKVKGYKMCEVSLDESGRVHYPAMRYSLRPEYSLNSYYYDIEIRIIKLADIPEAKTMTCPEYLRTFHPEIFNSENGTYWEFVGYSLIASDRIYHSSGETISGLLGEYYNGGGIYSYIKDGIMFSIITWDTNLLTEDFIWSISYDYIDLPEMQTKTSENLNSEQE